MNLTKKNAGLFNCAFPGRDACKLLATVFFLHYSLKISE